MIPEEVFSRQMSRLEAQFNHGRRLETLARDEYYRCFQHFNQESFVLSVTRVIETWRPMGQVNFPSVAYMLDIMAEVGQGILDGRDKPEATCPRCDNMGLYLAPSGDSRFCSCRHGEKRLAVWKVKPGGPLAEYRKAYDECDSDAPFPAVDQDSDDDKWLSMKSAQLEYMKRRNSRLSPAQRRRAGLTVILPGHISMREPGDDEDVILDNEEAI